MAKAIVLLSALCVLAMVNFAVADSETFDVEGSVFCDTCRLGYVSSLSEPIEGASVSLACKDIESGKETFKTEGKTDKSGKYKLKVEGDHEKDICAVTLDNKSPKDDCKETLPDSVSSRIVCSKNAGMPNDARFANALFYQKDTPIKGCRELIEQMELVDLTIIGGDKNSI